MTVSITTFCIKCHYAELFVYCYAECCYAQRRYAERRYAERRYAYCHYTECRCANKPNVFVSKPVKVTDNNKHAILLCYLSI
jgi:hypothetical protein